MTKNEFLSRIRNGLNGVTSDEIQKSFEFYREMIDDRIEDGWTEEEAVAAAGDPDELVKQILADSTNSKTTQKTNIREKTTVQQNKKSNSGLSAVAILLIIIGSPLWLAFLISAAAIVISVFATLVSIIVSLYTVVLALGIAAIFSLAMAITGAFPTGLLFLGSALICAGLTVLSFFAVNFMVKGIFFLCKILFKAIKSLFVRRSANENC